MFDKAPARPFAVPTFQPLPLTSGSSGKKKSRGRFDVRFITLEGFGILLFLVTAIKRVVSVQRQAAFSVESPLRSGCSRYSAGIPDSSNQVLPTQQGDASWKTSPVVSCFRLRSPASFVLPAESPKKKKKVKNGKMLRHPDSRHP